MAETGHDDGRTTVDPAEIARFSALAGQWWDSGGDFAPLHRFNPIRLEYIRDRLCKVFGRNRRSFDALAGLRVLDVGCGGGLVSEPLARMGASVTGIDVSGANVGAARAHAREEGVDIDYRCVTIEEIRAAGEQFDAVLCMEVVEHVADVDLFVECCASAVADGGAIVAATLNRTPRAFLEGIVVAEYLLRWLPRGTHDWRRFVRPSELARALRRNGFAVSDLSGLSFDPLAGEWRRSANVSVNYILSAERLSR